MLNNRYSYHQSIRRAIVAFGTLFNGIYVRRRDLNGNVIQSIAVPLSYGPKQKFIQRIAEAPTLDTGRSTFENILPHLGFEIVGLEYDPSRKLVPIQQNRTANTDGSVSATYVSTPYNLNLSLTAWVKNQDDGLQITEQILPYFNPEFNVPVIDLPELGIMRDLMIELKNVTMTDDYTGNYEQRVAILWEFNFTMKINIYGYVAPINVIRTSIANVYTNLQPPAYDERVTVTTNPAIADPSGSFDYITQFDRIGI